MTITTTRKLATGQHHFSSETHACTKCSMSEEYFEDHGRPPCSRTSSAQLMQQRRNNTPARG
jgi:hypothetical protein